MVEINGLIDEEAKLQGLKGNSRVKKKFYYYMRNYCLRCASKIVVVNPVIKMELEKKYKLSPDKISIIPNGANIELFKPIDKHIAKKKLGMDIDKKYVCFVGNLAPWQGVEYLIKSAPLVIKSINEVRFLIVGDGKSREVLENCVREMDLSDYFIFTGSVEYDSVPYYINASDVCISIKKPVLPGSPIKVFEYMACGRPVVATKKSEYGFEILEESGAGILVDQDNIEEVSGAIIFLLNNPGESMKKGSAGRKLVVENFSWRNTALKVEQICSSVSMH